MKKRRKLEGGERDRFGRNMAQLSRSIPQTATDGTGERWAALRGFIGMTMEKSSLFSQPKTETEMKT